MMPPIDPVQQEMELMLRELEEWIYRDSLYIAGINSEHLNYIEMLTDASDTMKLYIELQQQQNGEGEGEGQGGEGSGQQQQQDMISKVQQFLKKRSEKENGEEQQPEKQQQQEEGQEGEGQAGEQSSEEFGQDKEEAPPANYDVSDVPFDVCKELWGIIGEENYRKVEKRMAINNLCHVKSDKLPGMTYYYKIGSTRRSAPAIPVKVNGKIIRVAFCPELREIVVGV